MAHELVSCGTNRTYARAAIAFAAFARVRSIGISVAQKFSPNRPLDRAKKVESQTVLSLHGALTHKVRTLQTLLFDDLMSAFVTSLVNWSLNHG